MKRQLLSFLITAPGVLEAQAIAQRQIQIDVALHQGCRADGQGLCLPAGAPQCLKTRWPLPSPDCRDGFIVIKAGQETVTGKASAVGPKAN